MNNGKMIRKALVVLACLSASTVHAQVRPTSEPRTATAKEPVIRAQVTAVRQAVLSSELSGKLVRLPFLEGTRFKQGDVLAAFDCSLHRARMARSTETEAAAKKQLDVATRLDKLDSISVADLSQARSAVAVGKAESAVERAMVQRCTITAPFSGRVGNVYVRQSEYVPEGKELISIYQDDTFELEMIVPSRWLAWLKPDYPISVMLDETGVAHQGKIVRIAGAVDPVSQSVKVTGRLQDREAGLLPGMSGTVTIKPPVAGKAS